MSKHQLVFDDKTIVVDSGANLLEEANQAGVFIETYCGGNGQCGKCRVALFDQQQGLSDDSLLVSSKTSAEQSYIVKGSLKPNERLACCVSVYGDLSVQIPKQKQTQVVSKKVQKNQFSVDQLIYRLDVWVPKSNLYEQSGELELLKKALWYQYGVTGLSENFSIIQKLPAVLLQKDRQVSVVIRDQTIIDIYPQDDSLKLYGIAFDIGSTTIAASLSSIDSGEVITTKGVMNPQIQFGDDVMSRVSYAMMNEDGLYKMNRVLVEAINQLILDTTKQTGISKTHIYELVFVANPIIHHLLLNLDPIPLGQSPFSLATDKSIYLSAKQLNINVVNESCYLYVLPCIAGHVGADAAAVLLSLKDKSYLENTLVVDIGTNAEIILLTKEQTYACSSPTGPAFEGAQIHCGQRAAIGAIEKVEINPKTYQVRFKVIGCDLWSDDPSFLNLTGDIEITGICGSGIIDAVSELFLAKIINQDGIFDHRLLNKTDLLIQNERTCSFILYQNKQQIITVTQNDIRQIQLAKAALYAGVKLLLKKANLEKVDQIYLAGAFGNHIDVKKAMILGIIPDCSLNYVQSIGNAAGEGAVYALLSLSARHYIEERVKTICKIESAIEPKFQDYFVSAMSFPNQFDQFLQLEKIVTLPKPFQVETVARRSRRRARKE